MLHHVIPTRHHLSHLLTAPKRAFYLHANYCEQPDQNRTHHCGDGHISETRFSRLGLPSTKLHVPTLSQRARGIPAKCTADGVLLCAKLVDRQGNIYLGNSLIWSAMLRNDTLTWYKFSSVELTTALRSTWDSAMYVRLSITCFLASLRLSQTVTSFLRTCFWTTIFLPVRSVQ